MRRPSALFMKLAMNLAISIRRLVNANARRDTVKKKTITRKTNKLANAKDTSAKSISSMMKLKNPVLTEI